jgi:hypothetical protein
LQLKAVRNRELELNKLVLNIESNIDRVKVDIKEYQYSISENEARIQQIPKNQYRANLPEWIRPFFHIFCYDEIIFRSKIA